MRERRTLHSMLTSRRRLNSSKDSTSTKTDDDKNGDHDGKKLDNMLGDEDKLHECGL